MRFKLHKYSGWEAVYFVCFYLLVFQNPLAEHISPLFSYVDELFSTLGIAFICLSASRLSGKMKIKRSTMNVVVPLLVFVICGLIANIFYHYQPTRLVLKDLYVNLKFFFAILAGFYLFKFTRPSKKLVLRHAKFCSLVLFLMLLVDVLFDIFPNAGYRYGIAVRNLIFEHVTYIAGVCIFLLSVFLLYYERKNWKYAVMTLLVLASTMRLKALAGAVAYLFVTYYVLHQKRKIKLWHIFAVGLLCVWIAWDQIIFYYVDLSGRSARSVMTQTSFEIMKDYFPIGTGFGTYASDVAGEYYSPVYEKYGFREVHELQEGKGFFSDTFWPIIVGQTGFVGTISYISVLMNLFLKAVRVRLANKRAYAAAIYVFIYLIISSIAEPTFCNAVSIPLAMIIGQIYLIEEEIEEDWIHSAAT